MTHLTPYSFCVPLALGAMLSLGALGCTGELSSDAPVASTHESGTETVPVGPGALIPPDAKTQLPPDSEEPGPLQKDRCLTSQESHAMLMRRLSHQELETTLTQVFEGLSLEGALEELPPDEKTGLFSLNVSESAQQKYVTGVQHMAEDIAVQIAQAPERFLGCKPDKACVRGYLEETFWPRAIQRPLNGELIDRLMALYTEGEQVSATHATRLVFEALLQSPSFLYKDGDLGAGGADGHVALSDLQIAYRMAALLWRGVPDEELLAAAERGELREGAGRSAQAERMLEDPLAKLAISAMLAQWFNLDGAGGELPGVEDEAALLRAMRKESMRFIDHVVQEEGASYKVLLSAPYTFLDERMVKFHGIKDENLGEKDAHGMWRVTWAKRAGILMHPAVLSQYTHHGTIHRGKMIRQNILCDVVANLDDPSLLGSIETTEKESQRSQALKRMEHPTCTGCHMAMEPLGLPFDVFDGIGRLQSEDTWGNPVHGGSTIVQTQDIDGQVSDPVTLAKALAGSKDVENCVATQLFTYSFSHLPKGADQCTVDHIQRALIDSEGSLSKALLAIVTHPTFAITTQTTKETTQ